MQKLKEIEKNEMKKDTQERNKQMTMRSNEQIECRNLKEEEKEKKNKKKTTTCKTKCKKKKKKVKEKSQNWGKIRKSEQNILQEIAWKLRKKKLEQQISWKAQK